MYIFCIVLILIASVLIILAVLAQSPKSGMAANFGASNQVMGVRQTADFLEKFTWGLAISIVVLSLAATMTMPSAGISSSKSGVEKALEQSLEGNQNLLQGVPATEAGAAAEAPAENAEEAAAE
ncbi:preprotein translocase subunit SecG [uncultured Alistipes sp.]|uniref:preprotein translocase subunit SecG n=1 Tax=uncultured Alistipes sp. TaxID=538949 RepID=UPI00262A00D5|nr:preprotein translocase subunit SecG [uncultured Alistipes sp.]